MLKEIPSAAAEARKQEFKAIRNEIEKCELQVKVADEIIAGGNRDLDVALDSSKKTLEKLPQLPKQNWTWSWTKKTAWGKSWETEIQES